MKSAAPSNPNCSSWILLSPFHCDNNDSDSDDEAAARAQYQEEQEIIAAYADDSGSTSRQHGGSVVGRKYINRDHAAFNKVLLQDYFVTNPTYGPEMFRRRFRMRRELFVKILSGIQAYDNYFILKKNAFQTQGLSGHQKMTAAMRMLAYGSPADAQDENLRIAESTALEALQRFCQSIVDVYGSMYLRRPSESDVANLLEMHGNQGWPGMLGSLDCMHWEWKNCPKAYHGAYNGKIKKPTIILEAVASSDMWIWHANFGMPGSNNDLNALERSTLFNDLALGKSPPVQFTVGRNQYHHGYYLGDGIYPKWSIIVKTYRNHITEKQRIFAMRQEGQRKDVERAFGVLQSRFAMISRPCRLWKRTEMTNIMFTCIILHNMIIEDERDVDGLYPTSYEGAQPMPEIFRQDILRTDEDYNIHISQQLAFRNEIIHDRLQRDLMDHIWNNYGNQ